MSFRELLNGYLRLPRKFFGIPESKDGFSDIGILGVPYDITSSYQAGPREAPDVIRQATDSERSHSYPLQIGLTQRHQETPLSERITIEDMGDLEVGVQHPESVAVHISNATQKLADTNSNFLFLGGDHFITYPLIRGIQRKKNTKLGLVYLDSHADFYKEMGGSPLSHATTLRRITEQGLVAQQDVIVHDARTTPPDQYSELQETDSVGFNDIDLFTKAIGNLSIRVDEIYISVDMDILSPEVAPGVSHPESGGLNLVQLLGYIRAVFQSRKVRYADVVEFNPMLDKSGLTSVAVRDLVKEILTGFAHQKESL